MQQGARAHAHHFSSTTYIPWTIHYRVVPYVPSIQCPPSYRASTKGLPQTLPGAWPYPYGISSWEVSTGTRSTSLPEVEPGFLSFRRTTALPSCGDSFLGAALYGTPGDTG